MIKKLIYWGVSVFFCILPVILVMVICYLTDKSLVNGIKNSSEILYTIVVLCGLIIYDLADSADDASKHLWWFIIITFLGFVELLSCSLYGIFLYASYSLINGGEKFLEKIYPYSAYIAGFIIIFGIPIQLTLGAIKKKNG
jgi:hypothetical protein